MLNTTKEYLTSFQFSSLIALCTYWLPLVVCATVYTIRSISQYRSDIEESKKDYYCPTITVGNIINRFLASILPAVNVFAMVFDCADSVFRFFSDVLDRPLVGRKNKE